MTKKKPTRKKAAKKKVKVLASVEITPEVEEILKSSEAKLYLRGIERANVKLQTMIAREMALLRHPAHPDHPKG